MSMSQKTGAVLVVGGGIGGIQASLDLAESGYKVYLVEKSPAIGGTMAQLDKTFPTNDCAMCILSPKLVECGRHLNIEVITHAELKGLKGKPGSFKAVVEKKPRYVDIDKCTGCGECALVCPVELPNTFDEGLAQRKAIFRPFAQAYPSAFSIDKKDRPPCVSRCPAHVNAQGYIALISKGKYKEALDLIKEKIPLPGVIGRICPHPCEAECTRGTLDEPLAICSLKRFTADRAGDELAQPEIRNSKEKVAIIGSGPGGLSAAYYLAIEGYQVTIFEALPVAGGMLYVGIPAYRLPKDILEKEIQGIRELGVEIKTNTPIGKELSLTDLSEQGYKAIFISIGAHRSLRLGIPGEDSIGVIDGVTFLRELNLGKRARLEGHIAIIGGGDVAIDAARSALRLGAKKVSILYRRSRAEMPASDEEIEAALAEGVDIQYLVAPVEALCQDGKLVGIRCSRMELGAPDASGRRRPLPIEGSEFDITVDMLLPAIGQAPEISFIEGSDIETTKRGTIAADPLTLATNREGIFAGGDALTGPGIAIEAIAAGSRAAVSIDRYLRGEDITEGRALDEEKPEAIAEPPGERQYKPRVKPRALSIRERRSSFREVELGLSEQMALQEAQRCLNCGICSECMQCIAACKAEAINHLMRQEEVDIEVGSVILCPGFDEFDASIVSNYGYGTFPNVVTSIEFERMLSASGPFQGELLRPSDKKSPQRIAWIQCVGSRDIHTVKNSYCSSVCCTYAIKEAVVAKEHSSTPLETTIFFIDIRTYGKDFESYYERAKKEHGVRFIRSQIHRIYQDEKSDLTLRFVDESRAREERFDLVVLSVGLRPPVTTKDLAENLGLELNQHGFCQVGEFSPVATSKPGIFTAGVFSGPKDIPETVMEASAAASEASCLLSPARHSLTVEKEYPQERDVTGEKPRIGVFICHCGINIGGVVDVPGVKEYASSLPNVVFVDENLFTCSQDTQQLIREKIEEHNLNRVVVASCTPRTHEPLFQETLREAGLNKYLFEMANIRDQCSWVHMHDPDKATEKAKDLVRMAVAKARLIKALPEMAMEVNPAGLVVGGGISGMTAALNIAEQGFEVHLVERASRLGGIANRIQHTLEGRDVQAYLKELVSKVSQEPLIHVYKDTDIQEVSGYVGNFKTRLMERGEGEAREINHGVAIIASGGDAYRPDEYLYGKNPGVFTMLELEEEMARGNPRVCSSQNVVMIQCVGSREEERPYCSRTCCSEAVGCALKMKDINPEANIYILYRDIRTYGFKETYYEEARAKGVLFIPYDVANKPDVQAVNDNDRDILRIKVNDPILGETFSIDADVLALAAAIVPSPGKEELAQLFKVPLNEDGFFLEAHVKLRPVDFATDGVFVCGLAHGPKLIEESITQAKAAASRAVTILSKDRVEAGGAISTVDKLKCNGCGMCVEVCPFNAIEIDAEEKIAVINEALCKGCGVCASSCRSGVLDIMGFSDEEILSMIKAS